MAIWRLGFVHLWFNFLKPDDVSTRRVQMASQFQSFAVSLHVILLVFPLITIIRSRYFLHKDTNKSNLKKQTDYGQFYTPSDSGPL